MNRVPEIVRRCCIFDIGHVSIAQGTVERPDQTYQLPQVLNGGEDVDFALFVVQLPDVDQRRAHGAVVRLDHLGSVLLGGVDGCDPTHVAALGRLGDTREQLLLRLQHFVALTLAQLL